MTSAQPATSTFAANRFERFFHEAYAARFDVPRRADRPLIGYLSCNVPVELVRAAGAVPFEILGRPDDGFALSDAYLEPCFDGHLRAVAERFLRGDFAEFDLVIVPRSSEGMLQLYYYLTEIQRREPRFRVPPLHLFDLLHTPYRSTARYVRAEVERLRTRLEAVMGGAISDAQLREEIARSQARLARYAGLREVRAQRPAQVSGTTSLAIFGSQGTNDRDAYDAALEALLASPASFEGPRLMVKGSAQHSLRLYRELEAQGTVVVADDHLSGELGADGSFDTSLAPMDALAHRYHRHSSSIRSFPQASADAAFIARVKDRGVDGVVFCYDDTDDTYGWEYPDQKRALDDMKIPSLLLTGQRFFEAQDQGACIEPFIGAVKKEAQ